MPRRRQLKKEKVLDTAVALANESGGFDQLTLTALAAELDVRVPSLYNHVAGLNGLHDDLALYAGRLLLDELRRAAYGLTGKQALRAMAAAYRRFATEQPALYPLTIIAPDPGQEERQALAQELLQWLLLTMASLGLEGEQALHAIRAFRAALHGFVSLEAAGGFKMDLERDQSFDFLIETYLDAL